MVKKQSKKPRIDEKLLDKIIIFVKEHPSNQNGIYLSEIAKEFGINQSKARTYCIVYAVQAGRMKIHEHGQARSYPTVIDSNGVMVKRNFNEVLHESSALVIDFFMQNPSKLDNKLKDSFEKLQQSIATGSPNIGAQEKLVKHVWSLGYTSILCAKFNNKAYRVC